MTACLEKGCSFGLLFVFFFFFFFFFFLFVCASFSFCFEGRMWDLIVLIPDHCLSIYFLKNDLENPKFAIK